MTTTETAAASADAVANLSSHFMLDMATYQRGGELGFAGMDFYVAGRGGVLGEVDADVVSAAFVFFNPVAVRAGWDGASGVMPRREAAEAFAACGHEWARAHLDDGPDLGRVVELTSRVVAAASPAGAPVFAGWRLLASPGDDKAAVVHQMNGLRELRMAMHGCAVLASGLAPVEALLLKTPAMAPVFGWTEDLPDVNGRKLVWDAAEAATDVAFGRALAVLDETEQTEWVGLLAEVTASVS